MNQEPILDIMAAADINSADPETLVDICTVAINPDCPVIDRMAQYLDCIKNPYLFKVGETVVKIRFSDDGKSLENGLKSCFLGRKV